MTESAPPRIAPGSARSNPPPRRALPRVRPLGASGELAVVDRVDRVDRVDQAGPDGAALPSAAQRPATGRDLLIPDNARQARRKGRTSASVPTVAELMPAPEQRTTPGQPLATPRVELPAAAAPAQKSARKPPPKAPAKGSGKGPAKGKQKQGKSKAGPSGPAHDVAVQITVSKGLRKRLAAKAAELGLSPESAVAQLVEVWVDG